MDLWYLYGYIYYLNIQDYRVHTPQALVYDIRPPTTALSESAVGLGKLSATDSFSLVAVSLYQIISGVSFVTAHVAYASRNKTRLV